MIVINKYLISDENNAYTLNNITEGIFKILNINLKIYYVLRKKKDVIIRIFFYM